MNARDERSNIFTQSPIKNVNSHYDTVIQHLQRNLALIYTLTTAILVYLSLGYFRFVPLSVPQVVWNIIVHLTPSRIVVALDSKTNSRPDATDKGLLSMSFQAKSEAMQRILGIDNNSFSSFLPSGTAFSGFGNALLGKDILPPGLGNWDNSCFQNSIIQGFASLQSLAEFLTRNTETLGDKGSFLTHQALGEIVERLNSASEYGQKLWIPPNLKSMSSWQQQDAQEYYSKVVDQIDHEVQQTTIRQTRNLGLKMAGPEENVFGSGSSQNGTGDSLSTQTSETPFNNPLEGLLAQRVGCMKCGWSEGLSLIPFNCLTVSLGSKFEYDIRECLDEYMDLEPIEGVDCAKCTLLRAQEQLQTLLKQIDEDDRISNAPDSPKVSDALRSSAQERLRAVEEALEENDFAEKTLTENCHITSKNRASSTKSRQAVIARSPKCLVVHINRSLFDETTGMLKKNYAAVRFPKTLDLNDWCLGARSASQVNEVIEKWGTNPRESMLPRAGTTVDVDGRQYELRAIITHYGRHENGHYICYRKYSTETFPAHVPEAVLEADGDKEKSERWYRLSDEDVQMVSEANVMSQGGAFMLFYEALEPSDSESVELADTAETATPEDMSMTSGVTERSASVESQATSVSMSEKAGLAVEDGMPVS